MQQDTLIRLAQVERRADFMSRPSFYISKHHDRALRAWEALEAAPQDLHGFATKDSLLSDCRPGVRRGGPVTRKVRMVGRQKAFRSEERRVGKEWRERLR